MRWRTHIAALLLALAAAAPAAAQAPAKAPGPVLSGALARVQAFYDRTTDYKASFRQVVQTLSPKRTFTRSGTVFFKRPGMMRWDYKVPDEVYYVSDGVDLWSYDVEEATVFRLKVERSELFQALRFLTGGASIAAEFEASEGPATAAGLVPLKLVPRTAQSSFRSVTLFVDPASGETRETEVVDPLGNVSHVWFTGPSFAPLPKDGFAFTPPAGVRVQDLSK